MEPSDELEREFVEQTGEEGEASSAYSFDKQLEQTRIMAEARREAMLNQSALRPPTSPSPSPSSFGTFVTSPLPPARKPELFTASFAWAPPPVREVEVVNKKAEEEEEDAMDLEEPSFFFY